MSNGQLRFENQIAIIKQLIDDSKKEKDRGQWLFENNIRTPFFMIQGLARLYRKSHNKKLFRKIEKKAKKIEDQSGRIDYFRELYRIFGESPIVSNSIKQYLKKNISEETKKLNIVLEKKGWLDYSQIQKIKKNLGDAKWKGTEEEVDLFQKVYRKEIKKIGQFLTSSLPFSDMENHVHELRRKLRWLSIYPQALNGAVELVNIPNAPTDLSVYQTAEIINSPYNLFQPSKGLDCHLQMRKPHFLALSWMIAELGAIKDKGLPIETLSHLYIEIEKLDDNTAKLKVNEILGNEYSTVNGLLEISTKVVTEFMATSALEDLVLK